MNANFKLRYFIILSLVFMVTTIVGTISHEFGHIAVAKYLGYDTELHYGRASYYPKGYLQDSTLKAYKHIVKAYKDIEYKNWPDEVKYKTNIYSSILEKKYWNNNATNDLLIFLGGPLQTTLTGIIGIIILFFRRKLRESSGLNIIDYIGVFLSLFWLRAVFNLTNSIIMELLVPNGQWFNGDEYYIAIGLNLWPGTFSLILGIIGLLVSLYILFGIISYHLRLTFTLSGLVGGIGGFVLWMKIIGPIILP